MSSEQNLDPIIKRNLDPELKEALERLPKISSNPDASREAVKERSSPQRRDPPHIKTEDRSVPGLEGAPDVPVRIYMPRDHDTVLPAFLNIHGGGMISGSIAMDDDICYRIVENVGCIVVSVEYRLAPEHPFPAAPEDCYSALQWMVTSAGDLGLNPERIGIGGPSAGGLLTAALALIARDRKEIKPVFQRILYGGFDNRAETAAYTFNPFTMDKEEEESGLSMWEAYLGKDMKSELSPYAVPARAEDLSGLPPAYIMVCELDRGRDEAIKYGLRLMQAGVSTELHVFPGAYHAFMRFVPDAAISLRAIKEADEALKRALYR